MPSKQLLTQWLETIFLQVENNVCKLSKPYDHIATQKLNMKGGEKDKNCDVTTQKNVFWEFTIFQHWKQHVTNWFKPAIAVCQKVGFSKLFHIGEFTVN